MKQCPIVCKDGHADNKPELTTCMCMQNKEEDIYEHVKKYAQPSRTENELYAQIKDSGITDISAQSIQ